MQAMTPLRTLETQEQRALAKEAHTVLVEAERVLMGHEGEKEPGLRDVMQKRLDALRDAIVQDPGNMAWVKECMEQLRMVSRFSGFGGGVG